MRYTDIAIISGGLSGSTAAAMLGRAGISTVLIDPHEIYPADFRVEKLSGQVQVERFLKTGIGESVLRRATFAGENWIARFGRLLDKAPSRQFNIVYDSLVNAIRDEISETQFVTVEGPARQRRGGEGVRPPLSWARFIAWSAQGLLRPLGGGLHIEPNFLGHSSSSSSSSSSISSSSSSSSLSSSAWAAAPCGWWVWSSHSLR
ncbi:hypothetical protein ACVWXO_007207 [Bradyrhizobium sp. LM2.7]